MDEVIKVLLIVMVLSLGVAITAGLAMFLGAERGESPSTPLLLASLVLLALDLWYVRKIFIAPEAIAGSK